jgi:hypothetical protein
VHNGIRVNAVLAGNIGPEEREVATGETIHIDSSQSAGG